MSIFVFVVGTCGEVVCEPGDHRQMKGDEREKLERHSRRKGEAGTERTNMKEKSQRDS